MKEYQEPVIEVIEFEMEEIMTDENFDSLGLNDMGEWDDLEAAE